MKELNSYETACVIAGLLDDKKASDIVILDIGRVSVLADYFVICSTDSLTQSNALKELLSTELKNKYNRFSKNDQNDQSGKWVLFDYGDVVIHILHKEAREYYAIEKFWSHSFVIDRDKWLQEYQNSQKEDIKAAN
ncbi:MAG: ribosome silencing factor [Vampirovibrionia bacterium]